MIYEDDPLTAIVGLCAGISAKTRRLSEAELKPLGLSYPQFGALAAAAETGGGRQRDLARRLESDVNTTMVVCAGLEARGLLFREADPADRRSLRINLSERGRSLAGKAVRRIAGLVALLPKDLPPSDVEATLRTLGAMYAAVKAAEAAKGLSRG
jgi:DNA-binding MarR family transcriptional regulator